LVEVRIDAHETILFIIVDIKLVFDGILYQIEHNVSDT